GVGEQLAEHGTQPDQDADAGQCAAEAAVELLDDVRGGEAGTEADGQRTDDQREERMDLAPGDQQDDHRDPDESPEDEEAVVSGPVHGYLPSWARISSTMCFGVPPMETVNACSSGAGSSRSANWLSSIAAVKKWPCRAVR